MIPLGVLASARVAAAGGYTYSFEHTADQAASVAQNTPVTWSSVPLGAEDANRWIIVVTMGRLGVTGYTPVSTVTINGVDAPLDYGTGSTPSQVRFHRLKVPTGTTATIVTNNPVASYNAGHRIGVYRIVAPSLTVQATATDTTPLTLASLAAGDVVLAGCVIDAALTWTGVNLDNRGTRAWATYMLSIQAAAAGDLTVSSSPAKIAATIAYRPGA